MNFKITLFLAIIWSQTLAQTIQLPLDPGRYAGANSFVAAANGAWTYSSVVLPPSIFVGAGKTSNLTSISPSQGVLWSYDYQYTKTSFPSRLANFQDGYLMAGFVFDGSQNKSLVRLDASGEVLWSKRYGSPDDVDTVNQGITQAIELTDGNIALAGGAASFASDQGDNDFFLAKIASDGSQIWGRRYCFSCGGNRETIFGNLVETTDGGFLLTGSYLPFPSSGQQILLLKTNADGDTEWVKSFDDPVGSFINSNDRGVQAMELPNGNFALIANQVEVFQNSAGIVAEIDPDGNLIRALKIRIAPGRAFTLQLNKAVNDGNEALVIAAGVTQDSTPDLSLEQNLLFKLNWDGSIAWQHNYYDEILVGFGTASSDLLQTANGGFAHLTNFSEGFDNFYPILILTDSLGETGCELPVNLSVETGLQLNAQNLTVTTDPTDPPTDYPITKTAFDFDLQTPSFEPLADTSICSPDTILLNLIAENIDTYEWSTGATTSQVSVTDTGLYIVTLSNLDFCFQFVDSVLVTLKPECDSTVQLGIPNAFSPNGDGTNDTFKPVGKNFILESIQVFDRWGELVFDKKDADAAWDGSYKGKPAASDVYIYKMTINERGKVKKYKGDLTLLR
jgi:gliding motility-associated-like protein